MSETEPSGYGQINDRLKQIVEQVSDESIELDAALDLFEEAVRLGVRASTMLEDDIAAGAGGQPEGDGAPDDAPAADGAARG